MNPLDDLRQLGARQHGTISRKQATALGIDRGHLRRAVARGELAVATDRVLTFVGAPDSIEQAMSVATLHFWPAYLSAGTALALWQVPGFEMEPIDVLVPRPLRTARVSFARVHTTTDLAATHITSACSLPVVTPIRAIFDLAGMVHPKRVERALDNAWSRRLVNHGVLHRTLDELAKRGRPGTVVMRQLADARPRSYRPPESSTEARTNELLTGSGHRPLRRQINAGNEDCWLGRFDLVDDECALVVEVHSDLFHGSRLDQERDAERRVAMEAAGWTFVECWENDVWRRPAEIVATIQAARAAARRNLSRKRAS
jgi:very-short-patch-repair endonuclease